ncbi:DUF4248 domain-containing protein [Parabacteroides sp. AM08-6]|uniref:DUF4248 domain-containing protein n=1 Tax=Parabacteroides sp. AM08-6 TaxID=2292053 RepID=UPI000EFEB44B|nr:DUF4248 domain-containing protein [Parabacteroides sp. AM08-6]RHJ82342.1 DUF4248 domain-containing protein [Parabacteroides sp. AM08-6]
MNKNRVWGHTELAVLYFPYMQIKSASTRLGVMIKRDEELLADLKRAGYFKGQRTFTPRQVHILLDHLGDPENWDI